MDFHNLIRSFFAGSMFNDRYVDTYEYPDDESDDLGTYPPLDSFHRQIEDLIDRLEQSSQTPTNYELEQNSSQPLRERMLKPGYQSTCQNKPYADMDLDDKSIEVRRLPSLGSSPEERTEMDGPNSRPEGSKFMFSSRSYVSRTYQGPDGRYVTETVTKDDQGNEKKEVVYHDSDPNIGGGGGLGSRFGRLFF